MTSSDFEIQFVPSRTLMASTEVVSTEGLVTASAPGGRELDGRTERSGLIFPFTTSPALASLFTLCKTIKSPNKLLPWILEDDLVVVLRFVDSVASSLVASSLGFDSSVVSTGAMVDGTVRKLSEVIPSGVANPKLLPILERWPLSLTSSKVEVVGLIIVVISLVPRELGLVIIVPSSGGTVVVSVGAKVCSIFAPTGIEVVPKKEAVKC